MNLSGEDRRLVRVLQHAVVDAAAHMARSLASPERIKAWRKEDQTLVLSLDLESHDLLHRALQGELPLVSEEDGSSHAIVGSQDNYILVDPLDGTSVCKRFFDNQTGQLGFGPLAGIVREGRVYAAVFYHLPQRTLFTAVKGAGIVKAALESFDVARASFQPLKAHPPRTLAQSAALFHAGDRGELDQIHYLRSNNLIDNVYCFGGFANDCSRVACGYEQLYLHFSVRAWDLPAALMASEAGSCVVVDPQHTKTPLADWSVQLQNRLIMMPAPFYDEVMRHFEAALALNRSAGTPSA